MFHQSPTRWSAIVFGLSLLIPAAVAAAPIQFLASGATAADIQGTVDAFRAAIGDPNNGNAAGAQGSGRREINWDGGGSTATAPGATPFTTFQNRADRSSRRMARDSCRRRPTITRWPRRSVPRSRLRDRVRALQRGAPVHAGRQQHHRRRLLGTWQQRHAPGRRQRIRGCLLRRRRRERYDDSVLRFQRYAADDACCASIPGGLSFAGVQFTTESIGSVRITTGNAILGAPDQDSSDVVTMDDFIYAEPTPVPEPATLLLSGLGLVGVCGRAIRRRRSPRSE